MLNFHLINETNQHTSERFRSQIISYSYHDQNSMYFLFTSLQVLQESKLPMSMQYSEQQDIIQYTGFQNLRHTPKILAFFFIDKSTKLILSYAISNKIDQIRSTRLIRQDARRLIYKPTCTKYVTSCKCLRVSGERILRFKHMQSEEGERVKIKFINYLTQILISFGVLLGDELC